MSTIMEHNAQNEAEGRGVCAWPEQAMPCKTDLSEHQYDVLKALFDGMAIRQEAILTNFEVLMQVVKNLRYDLQMGDYKVSPPPPRRLEKVIPFK